MTITTDEQAVETLLTLAEEYVGHAKNLAAQSTDAVKDAHEDDALTMAESDLKTLIERFANSTSLDDLFDSINQIYRDADNDPELKNWFKRVDAYIRKVLKQTGYIMEDAATDEWYVQSAHFPLPDLLTNMPSGTPSMTRVTTSFATSIANIPTVFSMRSSSSATSSTRTRRTRPSPMP